MDIMVRGWVVWTLFGMQLCLNHGSGTGLVGMGLMENGVEGQDTVLSPTLARLAREGG